VFNSLIQSGQSRKICSISPTSLFTTSQNLEEMANN